jgi:hypothetical protein
LFLFSSGDLIKSPSFKKTFDVTLGFSKGAFAIANFL